MYRIRPWLFISNDRDTCNHDLLATAGVGALLHLAADVAPPGIVTQYLPIEEGELLHPAMLQVGVQCIREQHATGKTVVVACGAGISRSTSFAMAALKEIDGCSLAAAAQIVRRAHPVVWASLCAFAGEAIDYLALVRMGEG
jgi:protein-tyrosine phosphatase